MDGYWAVEGDIQRMVVKTGVKAKDLAKLIEELKEGKDVTVASFPEADQVLFGAFPDAKKVRGPGPGKSKEQNERQIIEFRERKKREGGIFFHKDYLRYRPGDPEYDALTDEQKKELKGVLYGHETVTPTDHPHRWIAHVNIIGYTIEDGERRHIKAVIYVKPKG